MFRRSFIFAGVNAGYDGNHHEIKDPDQAVTIVKAMLSTLNNGGTYDVLPGKILYPAQYGCPADGETIAVIISEDLPQTILNATKYLKEKLLQSTMTIATYNEDADQLSDIALSRGFQAKLKDIDLKKVVTAWRNSMELFSENGICIAAGICQQSDTVVIQGETNPFWSPYDTDEGIKNWEKIAKSVFEKVQHDLNISIEFKMQDVMVQYLTKDNVLSNTNFRQNPSSRKTCSSTLFSPKNQLIFDTIPSTNQFVELANNAIKLTS